MEWKIVQTFLIAYGKDCALGLLAALFAYLYFKERKDNKAERDSLQDERNARIELASKLGEKLDKARKEKDDLWRRHCEKVEALLREGIRRNGGTK